MGVVVVDEQHVVRRHGTPFRQRRRRLAAIAPDYLPVGDLAEVLYFDFLAVDEDSEVLTTQAPHSLPLAVFDNDLEVDHPDINLLAEARLRRGSRLQHLRRQRRTEHRSHDWDQELETAPEALGQRTGQNGLSGPSCGHRSFLPGSAIGDQAGLRRLARANRVPQRNSRCYPAPDERQLRPLGCRSRPLRRPVLLVCRASRLGHPHPRHLVPELPRTPP